MGKTPDYRRADQASFIRAVSNDFNARYVALGGQLNPRGCFANQSSFFEKAHVHPSVDIGIKGDIDVSIFFFPGGVLGTTLDSLESAMQDVFTDQGVRRRSRNGGVGLVLPIASSCDLALPGLVEQTSDTLARLIEIARPIIDADAVPEVVTATEGRNPPWSRDELILAFELYVAKRKSLPGPRSVFVMDLSKLLNGLHVAVGTTRNATLRNSNGVAMKLQNFRRFEPSSDGSGPKGLKAGNRLEEEIWQTYEADPDKLKAVANAIRAAIADSVGQGPDKLVDALLNEGEDAPEGRVLTVLHLTRERSRALVERKKAWALRRYGRLACEGCEFDFSAHYGDRGQGFLECHHTRPVHTMVEGDRTKLEDLALLCANCHRMVHAKRPWLTVGELQNLVQTIRLKRRL